MFSISFASFSFVVEIGQSLAASIVGITGAAGGHGGACGGQIGQLGQLGHLNDGKWSLTLTSCLQSSVMVSSTLRQGDTSEHHH